MIGGPIRITGNSSYENALPVIDFGRFPLNLAVKSGRCAMYVKGIVNFCNDVGFSPSRRNSYLKGVN